MSCQEVLKRLNINFSHDRISGMENAQNPITEIAIEAPCEGQTFSGDFRAGEIIGTNVPPRSEIMEPQEDWLGGSCEGRNPFSRR